MEAREQLVPGEGAAWGLQEHLQELELQGREGQGPSVESHLPAGEVHGKRAAHEDGARLSAGPPPKHLPRPIHQRTGLGRLGEDFLCPRGQGDELHRIVHGIGQEEDGDPDLRTQDPRGLEPAETREGEVEDRDLGVVPSGKLYRLGPIPRRQHTTPLGLERS